MKKLFFLLSIIIGVTAFAQQDIPANYIWYRYTYGNRMDRYWADKALHVPRDTVYTKSGVAIIGSSLYYGDSTRWYLAGTAGVAIDTTNKWVNNITKNVTGDSIIYYIGSTRYAIKDSSGGGDGTVEPLGTFKMAVANTNDVKGLIPGYNNSMDSTSTNVTINSRDTIYILASGQSNAQGHQFTFFNTDTASNPFVQGWKTTTNEWVVLHQGQLPMGCTSPGVPFTSPEDSSMGAYFYFAKRLQEKTGKVVRVMIIGYGGNTIDNWIPESATNFAKIKEEMLSAGNPVIDYFIWAQGESDVSMSDTAYKRRIDTLTAQLDRQSWFGKATPMLMVTVTNTGVNYPMMQIQKAIYSGLYDKRFKLIDGTDETVESDNIHYSTLGQYNLANKMMQAVFNEVNMPNDYRNADSTELVQLRAYASRISKGTIVQDPVTKRTVFLQAPYIQVGDDELAATLASTKLQLSRLNLETIDDSTFNNPTFSLEHVLSGNKLSAIKWMRGPSGSNTGYLSFSTSAAAISEKMTLGSDGYLNLTLGGFSVPYLANKYLLRAGGFNIQSNAAVNNNFITSNIYYNGGFKYVANGTGVMNYFDALGNWVIQMVSSGTAGGTPTLNSYANIKNDGSIGLGTGMGSSLSVITGAAFQINTSGQVGIGAAPASKFSVLSTTEQERLMYDASNYSSSTVGSTGLLTINQTGAGAGTSFTDNVGIGTSTITHALTVNGQVRINAIDNVVTADSAIYIEGGKIVAGLSSAANIVKTLNSQYADVGNVGTGEDDLMTYTVPANTLSADGASLEFEMQIQCATASSKTIKVYFGATNIAAFANTAVGNITIRGTVIRTGAATQRTIFTMVSDSGAWAYLSAYGTAAETLSGTVVLKATGQATSNDDVVQHTMNVRYFPAN